MPKITNFDYSILLQKEQEMKEMLHLSNNKGKRTVPKDSTISNILNYSKALSVRPSKKIDYIEIVLN